MTSDAKRPYSALVGCQHGIDGQQVPCPPMCPVQQWPPSMFRLTFPRGRWVLRRKFRRGDAA